MATTTTTTTAPATAEREAADSPLPPPTYPTYKFGFAGFLKREYGFRLEPEQPICKAHLQGHCPNGDECPEKHPAKSNYNNLVCKHWLRGLCKKGDHCEFLHEYNLREMPLCSQWERSLTCANGNECLYQHLDPILKQPPCPHYERGYCPFGPFCSQRHVRHAQICPYFLCGFCPDGKSCKAGAHPAWREYQDLPKPKLKVILSADEEAKEREALAQRLEQEREAAEQREFGDGGRGGFEKRGRGRRGRGSWRGSRGKDRF